MFGLDENNKSQQQTLNMNQFTMFFLKNVFLFQFTGTTNLQNVNEFLKYVWISVSIYCD